MTTERKRTYKVYIIGQRSATETTIEASHADKAKMKFAGRLGIKTFEVNAVWDREAK